MRSTDHPAPVLILWFLQGRTTRSQNRAIVRHLLTGCRCCTFCARPLWRLADGRGRGSRHLGFREGIQE